DIHHGGEVQHPVHTLHALRQALRVTDISPVDRDAPLLERAGLLGGEREDPHRLAPSLQRRDDVPAHESVAPGDEDVVHAAAPLVARYHSTLRLTPSARSTCGANPSSRLARVMVNRFSPPRSCMP